MKKSFVLILIALVGACQPSPVSESAISQGDSLLATQTARVTSAVNGVNSLRGLFQSIDTIEFQRKTILAITTDTSLDERSKASAINAEIGRLNAGINRTKIDVQRLNLELETDSLLIDYIVDSIRVLNQMLAESESDMLDLEEHFAAKSEEYNDLVADYFALVAAYSLQRDHITKQSAVIYSVYYVIDTEKNLQKKGIIRRENGLWSFVQSKELNPQTDISAFTRSDLRKTLTIPIGRKKAHLLTSHPKASYRMETEGATTKRLVILDPLEFWRISRFLVIATS